MTDALPKTSSETTASHWDLAYLWHPFTQMQEWEQEEPLIIETGKGSYLIDTEGSKYLDGTSSIWVNLHGHRHPGLDRALKPQLDKIAHSTLLGLSNPPAIRTGARTDPDRAEGPAREYSIRTMARRRWRSR